MIQLSTSPPLNRPRISFSFSHVCKTLSADNFGLDVSHADWQASLLVILVPFSVLEFDLCELSPTLVTSATPRASKIELDEFTTSTIDRTDRLELSILTVGLEVDRERLEFQVRERRRRISFTELTLPNKVRVSFRTWERIFCRSTNLNPIRMNLVTTGTFDLEEELIV